MANQNDVRCPACGSTVTIDDRATTPVPTWTPSGIVEVRERPAVVAFCDGCDWCHEIGKRFLRRAA